MAAPGLDPEVVALGGKLFADRRLSGNGEMACSSCHDLANGGADGLQKSRGIDGAPLPTNTPTVFNCSLNFRQFWDGRAETLEGQIDGPLLSPGVMGATWPAVLMALGNDPSYVASFAKLYARSPDEAAVKNALATFERSLITPNSRFDRYLGGDQGAITADERHGYELFKSRGCIACHQGAGVGGNMYQTFGVMGDYFADRGGETRADLGRFNITKRADDRHKFKVPSLRNVALTAPYFHDGSAATLEAAIAIMGRYQLGRALPPAEVRLIGMFLRTLTGEYQGKPL